MFKHISLNSLRFGKISNNYDWVLYGKIKRGNIVYTQLALLKGLTIDNKHNVTEEPKTISLVLDRIL